MLQTGHAMRLRARTGLLLNVALVAWLGIMVMPCSVLAMDSVDPEPAAATNVAPDCHGLHAAAAAEKSPECCCDPLTITGSESPKAQRADLVAAAPASIPPAPAPLTTVLPGRAQPPPRIDYGPRVYLATQRFRI